jgi:hypothetical protein
VNAEEFDALISTLPELNARVIAKLATHVQKNGPWTNMTLIRSVDRLHEEMHELTDELGKLRDGHSDYNAVANECADVACMAMIVMYRVKLLERLNTPVLVCNATWPDPAKDGNYAHCWKPEGHREEHDFV